MPSEESTALTPHIPAFHDQKQKQYGWAINLLTGPLFQNDSKGSSSEPRTERVSASWDKTGREKSAGTALSLSALAWMLRHTYVRHDNHQVSEMREMYDRIFKTKRNEATRRCKVSDFTFYFFSSLVGG